MTLKPNERHGKSRIQNVKNTGTLIGNSWRSLDFGRSVEGDTLLKRINYFGCEHVTAIS